MINTIFNSDCIEGLKKLPDESVNCCVTSPPYFGLRDYGHDGQIGLEESPEAFVSKMVEVFTQVRRVLKNDGTLWLNLGDSYCSTAPGTMNAPSTKIHTGEASTARANMRPKTPEGMKPKDLIGIPWMVAFALRSSGWYLRQDIIWHKPNPMPESITDRCTKAHEYIFLLSKSSRYYYDYEAIKVEAKNPENDARRYASQTWDNKNTPDNLRNGIRPKRIKLGEKSFSKGQANAKGIAPSGNGSKDYYELKEGANKRSVWIVTTKPFSDAHFATFPEDLIVDCIKAGCPENGLVLDPFMGAGTTALVSAKLGRNYVGFELNPAYIAIAEKRLRNELGMFYPKAS
jgi:DNA modification methylase